MSILPHVRLKLSKARVEPTITCVVDDRSQSLYVSGLGTELTRACDIAIPS